MIKRIAALLMICLITLLAAGCSSDDNSEIVGEWTPSTVSIGGTTISYGDLNTSGKDFSFTFYSGGKCSVTIGGVTNEGSFTFNETSVDVEYGGKTQKLSYDRGILTLKLDYNGNTTSYMFTRVSK